MPVCATCASSYEGSHYPACGGPPNLSLKQINKALNKYVLVLLGGLVGSLVVTHVYPLLDVDPTLLICLLVFFAPIVVHLVFAGRKRLAENLERLKSAYKWTGVVLLVIVMLLFANGALDRAPSEEVLATVIRKSVTRGVRGGPSYHLIVSPSWRPGREEEKLQVNGATFSGVRTGTAVAIELHRGAIGLPWFSKVAPR